MKETTLDLISYTPIPLPYDKPYFFGNWVDSEREATLDKEDFDDADTVA